MSPLKDDGLRVSNSILVSSSLRLVTPAIGDLR